MKQRIGVIGVTGDLGSQLVTRLRSHHFDVAEHSRANPSIDDLLAKCDIVHVCAPTTALQNSKPCKAIVVLHDSVMSSSQQASELYLGGHGAVVHMLMNAAETIVIATDAPHHDAIKAHAEAIGLHPQNMTITEHDYMIARSQAPLALLCKVLLPYLYEQDKKGLLTPSGALLADTLRSRELVWTKETMHSILRNPQLQTLVDDMQTTIRNEKI
jgi:hypothetical protein